VERPTRFATASYGQQADLNRPRHTTVRGNAGGWAIRLVAGAGAAARARRRTQVQLVIRPLGGRMRSQLGRWEREDQPALAGVDARRHESVAKELTSSGGIPAEDNGGDARNHDRASLDRPSVRARPPKEHASAEGMQVSDLKRGQNRSSPEAESAESARASHWASRLGAAAGRGSERLV
jgi:hypothetical protein